jgi:WD40 repeat protein
MCLCGYGSFALSAGHDGHLRLWDVDSGQCVRTFTARGAPLTAVFASINEQLALTGDAEGRLTLWNLRTGEATRSLQAHSSSIRSVYLSGNMRYAVSASDKGKLRLWELPADRCVCTFDAAAPFSVMGDARYLVTGGKDGLLRLWSIRCDVSPRIASMMLCQAAGTAQSSIPAVP